MTGHLARNLCCWFPLSTFMHDMCSSQKEFRFTRWYLIHNFFLLLPAESRIFRRPTLILLLNYFYSLDGEKDTNGEVTSFIKHIWNCIEKWKRWSHNPRNSLPSRGDKTSTQITCWYQQSGGNWERLNEETMCRVRKEA